MAVIMVAVAMYHPSVTPQLRAVLECVRAHFPYPATVAYRFVRIPCIGG